MIFRRPSTIAKVTGYPSSDNTAKPEFTQDGVRSLGIVGTHLFGYDEGGKVVLVVPHQDVSAAVIETKGEGNEK